MKDTRTTQKGAAPKSSPQRVAANASDRPETKSQHPLKSSAPSDMHTLGRAPGGWLK